MYRKILDAGKLLQAIGVTPAGIEPLLEALGGKGVYIMTQFICRVCPQLTNPSTKIFTASSVSSLLAYFASVPAANGSK